MDRLTMDYSSMAIIALCSHLGGGGQFAPLEPREYNAVAAAIHGAGMAPGDLLDMDRDAIAATLGFDADLAERICGLAGRAGSMAFQVDQLERRGVRIVTRADEGYPPLLKEKLKESCPPLFYFAGDLGLLGADYVGYVGAREVDGIDEEFCRSTAAKTIEAGYGVVSGGARGIDSIAADVALDRGAHVIEFVGHSLQKHLRAPKLLSAVQEGSALVLSASVPTAGFNAGMLMARNKYIYAQSVATVVVRSSNGSGGTWAGATEALRKGLCTVLCWDNPSYDGNRELIGRGALPIDGDWDASFDSAPVVGAGEGSGSGKPAAPQQLSLFDE